MRKASLAILFLAGACASDRPDMEITSATPASVTVWGRWSLCFTCAEPEPAVSEQRMTDVALAHCAEYGKTAQRAYEERYEDRAGHLSGRSITFTCVAK